VARSTATQQGFGESQSGKRTLVELGLVVVALVLVFFAGRGCLGCVAEAGAEQVPTSVDAELGEAAAEQMRAKYDAGGEKPSAAQVARVERIFDELRAGLDEKEKAALGNPRVTVVVDDQVNAFALPGGEVFVQTGLLDRVGDDDEVLRGVLAHELGHAVRRHGIRLLARRAAFAISLALLMGNVDDMVVALAAGASELDGLSHSREMETEADEFGTDLLARTGHDSDGLARFLESLESQPVPELLSTHPDPAERARVIRDHAKE
jgi:predicted Zn-dependent protease